MSFANYNHRITEILKYDKIIREIKNIEDLDKVKEYFRWKKTDFKDTGINADDVRAQYESLIQKIDNLINTIQTNKVIKKSKWTVNTFSLFLFYLMKCKYENETRNLEEIKKLCKHHKYEKSPLNIQKTIQAIGTSNEKDPMRKRYIQQVITILDKEKIYPISLTQASNDYVSTVLD